MVEAGGGTRGPSQEAIVGVVEEIATRFRPERIVLFGSRAWGEPVADSDVDLLVVMETARRPIEEGVRIRQALGFGPGFPLDVVVRTPDQIRSGLAEGDLFLREVMAGGIVLYEAGDAGVGR